MGSAMSIPAAARGHRVQLVGTHLDEEIVRSAAGNGNHPRLGLTLPPDVSARPWTEFGAAMAGRPDLLVIGVSSAGVEWAIDRIVESVDRPLPIVMITKGLFADGERIEAFPLYVRRQIQARTGMDMPVMAIGGPCIAGELAAARDTRVIVTGAELARVEAAIDIFGADFYHARASDDVMGVEVCAAFKNFYALAVGWAAGRLERLGRAPNGAAMHNLAAGLFTQAIAEMEVLVTALGGEPATVRGLAGAGDLYVTCLAGRNSRMGRWLGLGLSYGEAKRRHMAEDTVEGAELALALGPTLEAMMGDGRLPGERMPLMKAILDAVMRDREMEIDWRRF
jgi:glycerol-3-phosphate dehydrogenase (NAD(P)+)